jgi:hypothetical protein
MSGLSRRAFLETAAAFAAGLVVTPSIEAGEPVAARPSIRDVNCDLHDALFESIRGNIAYVLAAYPYTKVLPNVEELPRYQNGSAVVLSIPESERGTAFDPEFVYMLTCRHCVARMLATKEGALFEQVADNVSSRVSIAPNRRMLVNHLCTVSSELQNERNLSSIPDLALLSFKRDGHEYPDGIPLYKGSATSMWNRDVTLAGRPHGGSPRVTPSFVHDMKYVRDTTSYSGHLRTLVAEYPVYSGHSGGAALVHEYGENIASLKDVSSSLAGITFGNQRDENSVPVNSLIVPPDQIRAFLIDQGILAATPNKIEVAAKPLK